ncbi:hypothetical protein ABB37_05470 [Leptomonas pyrrhocoris]|uniref:Vacuolar protein sorting 55 n=1 Tax=Leptomonas pyrrhocoris TaxID=157538 RepID=A0A0M9G055_LEPPY|nr:hypothetical protein ABB37_05470 [Leptomonas pyrrhocoris]XP_015658139.1 hypothetical protein ABB37_05470 [Leptomonas pyrrhocoris]KPA79699.1 hypothetical protein ABB37_05470 [Leptomonas pyrrhocoris]KPA79700.1 hypothetical protein ABB37_05470 [Leptomonas pyrrhocoris]|eukprot:XP_015658138.1 hypothetical protein ABB37_05470 [Leptomonas pyrrhocoris]
MSPLRPLVLSAFFLVLGFLFIILACTAVAQRNAWPLMSLVAYCFAPVPFFLCGRSADGDDFGDDEEPLDAFNTIGLFVGGMLLVSGPGLAVVLYHTAVISRPALVLALLGGCFFVAAAAVLCVKAEGEEEDDGYDF